MENKYLKQVEIGWSDLDPNSHILHSKYYDYGAYSRMYFLYENGMTPAYMASHHIGPILFREEAVFRKELSFGDNLIVSMEMVKCNKDMSRWSMRHQLYKNENILAAVISIEGAWINTIERKSALPPATLQHIFDSAPKAKDFTIVD